MTKLNQIIALEQGVRSRNYARVTELDKTLAKEPLLKGIARIYEPRDEEGEQLAPESQHVQVTAADALSTIARLYVESMNMTATKEWANTQAKADIALADGTTLMSGVPVTYLLFLEKQLVDIRTLIARLPILDPAKRWSWDSNANAWAAEPRDTVRTKKVPHRFVKYEATPEHPAQVDVFTEDETVGTWTTTDFSGALPAQSRAAMLAKVNGVIDAVKQAREAANDLVVTDQNVAAELLDYIFELDS